MVELHSSRKRELDRQAEEKEVMGDSGTGSKTGEIASLMRVLTAAGASILIGRIKIKRAWAEGIRDGLRISGDEAIGTSLSNQNKQQCIAKIFDRSSLPKGELRTLGSSPRKDFEL